MLTAPTGNVTLVFAEAERSPEGEVATGFPDAALLAALVAGSGYEVKTSPGSVMAAFSSAGAAVRWALASQEVVAAAGSAGLRIGIATGESIVERDAGTGRADYFGPTVNRAARIMTAANPGQTLLSESAHAAAATDLGPADDSDLGEHRLRGIERAERLHQVLPASWRGRSFPQLRTFRTLPTNLPPQTSSFVGREAELAALKKLHEDPSIRVVVLTGGAGVGKTRLAVRAAAALVGHLPGGVWFADVAEAGGAEEIAGAIAEALGLAGGANPVAIVGSSLAMRGASLVVLDTFDAHLAHAAATVGTWIERAPQTRFLITTRAATRLPGEREIRIEPLAVGTPDVPGPAIRLFNDRAREARPDFELSGKNLADAARICEELEGLPLAVELAAARVRILQPSEIVKKLGQKFQLLRSARKDTARRQQTLQGAIEWSDEQLSSWERAALRQFSVFRGGCDAEAADAVVDLTAHPGAPGGAAAARALVAKSLLSVRETDMGTRFDMSRTMREFAEARSLLEGVEGRAAAEARHATHYGKVAERVDAIAVDARDRTRPDLANYFAIQDRLPSLGPGMFETVAVAIAACRYTLTWIGPVREGAERFSRLRREQATHPPLPRALRINLNIGHLRLLKVIGNWPEALVLAEEAVALCREEGAMGPLSDALWEVAYCSGSLSGYRRSDEALAEAEKVASDQGIHARHLSCLLLRAARTKAQGKTAEALAIARKAMELAQLLPGRDDALSESMSGVANMLADADDPVEAARLFRGAIEIDLRIGHDAGRATKLGNLGDVLVEMGDADGALRAFKEAIEIEERLGRSVHYAYERVRESVALRVAGNLAAAKASLDEGESLLNANRATQLTAVTLMRRAEILFDMRDFPAALATAQQALAASISDEDVMYTLDSRILGTRALLVLGRPAEALEMLAAESSASVAAARSRLAEFGFLALLAQVHDALGNRDEAGRVAKRALELAEGVKATYTAANEKLRTNLPVLERIARA